MFATTNNNGRYVSIRANLDIEKGEAEFVVTTMYTGKYEKQVYKDFSKAAERYRKLSAAIMDGKEVA